MKLIWTTFILLFALMAGASAQDAAIVRDLKAKPGQDVRMAVFTSVRPDCTSGVLPTIRLVRPPEHGQVTMKKGKLSATNLKQCLAIEVPALIAIYRSAAGFEGSDSAIIEVRTAAGATQLQRYSITVSSGGAGQKT
jgi:hypothetical protein